MLLAQHIRLGALRRMLLIVCIIAVPTVVGCGGSGELQEENGSGSVPSSPEEADDVVVRVSGTQGTAYLGNYGTFAQEEPQTAEGTLGDKEPVEYAVEVQGGSSDGVSAYFQKTEPSTGELKVAIVADGEVVSESRTRARLGTVIADWLPEESLSSPAGVFEEEPDEEGA